MKQICKLKAPEVEILVVDDNSINLKIVEEILQSYEMKVSTALSGFECLSMLQSNKMKYDIIFIDHMMPEMDGTQTLHRIRQFSDEYYKKVPVIVLTANDTSGVKEEFLSIGFTDYMSKPIDITTLNKCLCNFIPPEKIVFINEGVYEDNVCCLQIDGVDTDLGLQYSNGNIDSYIAALRSVCSGAKEQKQLILSCKNQGDWKGYAIYVHGLKGVAASIGAKELAMRAKKHEFAAKEGDIEFIRGDFFDFFMKYDILLTKIQNEIGEKELWRADKKHVNQDLTKVELLDTIKLIENFECEKAIEKLMSIREFRLTEVQNKVIEAAVEFLEDLSYDESSAILISLIH